MKNDEGRGLDKFLALFIIVVSRFSSFFFK